MTYKEKTLEVSKKINTIKNFAKDMGYTPIVSHYTHCINKRPCISIALSGTSDNEGYAYIWAWYEDTYEEIN